MIKLGVLILERGNSLSLRFFKLGNDVTVIERFLELQATGLPVDLCGHVLKVTGRIDVGEAFYAC